MTLNFWHELIAVLFGKEVRGVPQLLILFMGRSG